MSAAPSISTPRLPPSLTTLFNTSSRAGGLNSFFSSFFGACFFSPFAPLFSCFFSPLFSPFAAAFAAGAAAPPPNTFRNVGCALISSYLVGCALISSYQVVMLTGKSTS